ncbi:hypothetical protein Cob_v001692 [Colletotrichum orbiculare MAFF 240422]|uniref:Uncharacterized protein n=1 Tax=Colletotrichum orbiculare (strain 104-T / ATCC 96160 / CBS 514.97 / LARS 414 / MAFF 240422) TaxID=1213857 RepID=A0A484G5L3_COLOR|nr:hypothetical protein Cob_v001692 [Colletotrichum orbiculare MAFF 240422]
MEMYFTSPDTCPSAVVKESSKQTVKNFMDATDMAKPKADVRVLTNTQPELERIINEYIRAKMGRSEPRKKTIIIVTDGAWEGMNCEYDLDQCLMLTFQISWPESGYVKDPTDISKIRSITIQFIQFGANERADGRLERLHDDLKRWGFSDLIDAEHAMGDVYKMFQGSLCEEEDLSPRFTRFLPALPILNSKNWKRLRDASHYHTVAHFTTLGRM